MPHMPSKEPIVEFSHVTKNFSLQNQKTFKEFLPALIGRKKTKQDFTALDDISFSINQGDSVGIIGPNGSGKSTILKLIAGVMQPTSGKISVRGKVSPLIELGAGFHPELTGRENIFLNGAILGLDNKTIKEKLDYIIGFSELSEFIDQPVKHYSSGMYMRLGFSIAINVNPEVLIIDEILAVGDAQFQQKCFTKIQEYKNSGITILFVSHSLASVKSFCNLAIYVDHSRLVAYGEVNEVSKLYEDNIKNNSSAPKPYPHTQ